MKELREIRINGTELLLEDNLVRGSILPEKASELARNIIFKGETVVEGPIYGNRIEVSRGPVKVHGAVFAHNEFYVDSDATGNIELCKTVASSGSVVSRGRGVKLVMGCDVNARSVSLTNALVCGSIYADEVTLDHCVVIGGVFATQQVDLTNSMVGTFNGPSVRLAGDNYMLLPSAFSVEPVKAAPGTTLTNLSLADLGALYRGAEQSPESGKIEVSIVNDQMTTSLVDDNQSRTLRSYSVIGKVLAADLVNTDRFQNHFLLTAAALGPQLLKSYDLGDDAQGQPVPLTREKIGELLFGILDGRVQLRQMDGKFSLSALDRH